MSKLVNIELPFSGFYNSIHDDNIDRAIEDYFNYDPETGNEKEITPEISDAIWSADVDWDKVREEYCKHFVEEFGDKFELDISFDELTSPREYNFSTDRLFCKVPKDQIDKIRREVEAHKDYPEYINENFTSRSGFWSSYSEDYKHEEWTRDILDECQYRVILQFWLDNISLDAGNYWDEEEQWICDRFEMMSWPSVNKAYDKIEEYLKEHTNA